MDTKLFPILCIIMLLLLFMTVVNFTETDVFALVPTNIVCGSEFNRNFVANTTTKHLLESYEKHKIIDALYETITQSQINKIINELQTQHKPSSTSYIQTQHKPSSTSSIPLLPNILREIKPIDSDTAQLYNEYISMLSAQFPNDTSFYTDLQAYKVILKYGKSQGGYFTFPINKLITIHRKERSVATFIRKAITGFGNGLSIFWGAQSLALWMNYNFVINSKSYHHGLEGEKKNFMTAFLPTQKQLTHNINDSLSGTLYFMPGIDDKQHSAIHPTSLLFLYYNPYFQVIMHQQYMSAMHKFYAYNNRLSTLEMREDMRRNNDVVIHIRCGDVLQLMHNVIDWDYGFLTMKYYRYLITDGIKEMFGINWKKEKINNNTNVWIISQLSKKGVRKGEISALSDCNYLINFLVDNALKEIFHPAILHIGYDSDVNNDFYRMLVAPLLICSPSTFCFNAGAGNMDGFVIIPNRGAWIDFRLIDSNYSSNTSDSLVILRNSRLIPENQMIVDTEKRGYHCNKIDNYQYNKAIYEQKQYTAKLAEYLITH